MHSNLRTRTPWLGAMALACVLAWSAGSAAGPRRDTEPTERVVPTTFVVECDGKRREGVLGKSLKFACAHAEGRSHAVVMRAAEPQRFNAYGVVFDFPAAARLTEQRDGDWTFLSLELTGGAAVTLEILGDTRTPKDAIGAAVAEAQKEWVTAWRSAGLRGSRARKVGRDFAGGRAVGVAIEARLAGPTQLAEIYVLPGSARTVRCTLEWDSDVKTEARKAFDALCRTLVVR